MPARPEHLHHVPRRHCPAYRIFRRRCPSLLAHHSAPKVTQTVFTCIMLSGIIPSAHLPGASYEAVLIYCCAVLDTQGLKDTRVIAFVLHPGCSLSFARVFLCVAFDTKMQLLYWFIVTLLLATSAQQFPSRRACDGEPITLVHNMYKGYEATNYRQTVFSVILVKMFKTSSKHVLRKCSKHVPVQKMFRRMFKRSSVHKGCSVGCSKDVEKMFKTCSKDVQKMLQRCSWEKHRCNIF